MKLRVTIAAVFAMVFLIAGNLHAANGDLVVNGNLSVNGSLSVNGTNNLLPAGAIAMFGGSTAPAGWLICNGSAVSRTTYATLFAAIGTTYGAGDGSTTFNLPDMRGRAAVGAGTGTGGGASGSGLPSGGTALSARSVGNWFGEEKHTLMLSEMPAHTHSYTAVAGTPLNAPPGGVPAGAAGSTTGTAGSGSPHNVIQPSMVVNYIIKY